MTLGQASASTQICMVLLESKPWPEAPPIIFPARGINCALRHPIPRISFYNNVYIRFDVDVHGGTYEMLTSQVLAKQLTCPFSGHAESVVSNLRFDTEFALVVFFERLIGLLIDPKRTGLLREFDSPNGIADIVLLELHDHWECSIALKDIPPRWAYWLHCLPHPGCFTTEDARRIAGVTRRQAITFLKLLVDLGFCEKVDGNDEWRIVTRPNPLVEGFYAIEAKLRDWKRALSQAARYRDYAVQSWVLLDERAARPALENIEQFERLNIGLATISPSEQVLAHFVPQITPPKSQLRYWQANAEVAQRLILGTKS